MALMRFLLWSTFVAFTGLASAATDPATAEALMRKSGLWEQLADIAPQVRAGVLASAAQRGHKPSDAELERLSRAVDSAYSAHRLRSACAAIIAKDLNPTHVAALARWYDGPTGQAITRLEEAHSRQADPRAALDQGAAQLRSMPESRRRKLDEIVLVTGVAELGAELYISSALASARGAASISPNAAAPSAAELKAALDAQRQQLIRAYSAFARVNFAATFSSVATADLAAYVDFLKSDAGRHFIAITTRAFSAAMLSSAAEFGRALPGSRDKART